MIKILRFVKDPNGARLGYIDCVAETKYPYEHNDIELLETNGRKWIKMPDSRRKTGEINAKGYPVYRRAGGYVDPKTHRDFQTAVIAALDQWLAAGNKPEIAPPKEQRQQQAAPAYGAGSNGAYEEQGVPF